MMKKYTVKLDKNGYVLSIAHTQNDNVELDLSAYDMTKLNAYRLIDGALVLDENKLAEIKALKEKDKLLKEREELEAWLSSHDYIGTKIATGRATVEDYAVEIAEMTTKANRINEINELLRI